MAAVAALCMAGCKEEQKSHIIAFITSDASDFWTFVRNGAEKAEKELNGKYAVEFRFTSGANPAEQQRLFEDVLARGVQGIVISPIDPDNSTRWLNEGASQTALFTCESDAPNSNRICYFGTKNKSAGIMAGQSIREALPDGGRIVVFCDTEDSVRTRERLEGLRVSVENKGIEIVDVRTDDTDRLRAIANAEDAIVKYPDLAGMVGLSSYSGPAIYSAVKSAGKQKKIKIVCFDEEPLTLKGIKEEGIYATIVQQPFQFGYEAVMTMDKYLEGVKNAIRPSKEHTFPSKKIGIAEVWDYEVLHR